LTMPIFHARGARRGRRAASYRNHDTAAVRTSMRQRRRWRPPNGPAGAAHGPGRAPAAWRPGTRGLTLPARRTARSRCSPARGWPRHGRGASSTQRTVKNVVHDVTSRFDATARMPSRTPSARYI
jgi:hypothetical protein